MVWITQHKNFNKDLYILAVMMCTTRLDNANNILDEFVRDSGGAEKCKPNFVACTLESDRQVEALTLTHQDLTGTIPPDIGYLTSLKELKLEQNKLVGSLPSTIGALTRSEVPCEQEVQRRWFFIKTLAFSHQLILNYICVICILMLLTFYVEFVFCIALAFSMVKQHEVMRSTNILL